MPADGRCRHIIASLAGPPAAEAHRRRPVCPASHAGRPARPAKGPKSAHRDWTWG